MRVVSIVIPARAGLGEKFWGKKYRFPYQLPGTWQEYDARNGAPMWRGFPNHEE